VPCHSCGSPHVEEFESEISLYSRRLKHIDKRPVLVFTKSFVCLNCGNAEFVVPRPRLVDFSSGTSRDAKESSKQPQ